MSWTPAWTSAGAASASTSQRLQEARPALNVAAFVGHGALHPCGDESQGESSAPSTADEVDGDGAARRSRRSTTARSALSSGLEYWPGNTAPAWRDRRTAAVVGVAARRGGLYSTHVRNRDVHYDLGFTEAVATARHDGRAAADLAHPAEVRRPPAGDGRTRSSCSTVPHREGVDVAFDVIPHDWSHTSVAADPAAVGARRRHRGARIERA